MRDAFAQTIKRMLVRFKQKDLEFVIDNWSVFPSRNFDLSAAGRTKAKLISAVLERIKVMLSRIVVYRTEQCTHYACTSRLSQRTES